MTASRRPGGDRPLGTTAGRRARWLAGVCLLALVGCSGRDIDTTYGRMSGVAGGRSVNGTAVLAEMMRDAGYEVGRWSRLSPRLDGADVIVWAPDDFVPPRAPHRAYLEQWLAARPNRTLVYIGRHYDAAIEYYQRIRQRVRGEQAIEASRRAAQARAAFDQHRYAAPPGEPAGWFQVALQPPALGKEGWSGAWGRDLPRPAHPPAVWSGWQWPSGQPAEPLQVTPLLRWGGEPLVWEATRPAWHGSRILFVRDGSLLLNLPLVDPAHRQLAGRLIASCSGQSAVFLESGPEGPPISHQQQASILGLAAFRVWPLSMVLLHWTMVGVLFCLAVFPIFGRPRRLPAESTADFGAHVEALGQLLGRQRPQAWARQRIQHARQLLGIAEPEMDPGNPFRREPQA